MSLRANIEHLSAAQGIEAVAVVTPTEEPAFRGDPQWRGVLDGAVGLLGKTEESTIRLVIGKSTVVVQTEGEETVAVVLPTGHAIAKSLRRMIRRMSRKVRPPLRQEAAPAPAAAATTPSGPPVTQNTAPTTPSTSDGATSWG